jgi:cytochrome c553
MVRSAKAAPILSAFVVGLPVSPVSAAEISKFRFEELKMECDTCHGFDGWSPTPEQVPSIARKNAQFILSQLRAFEAGKRHHETMVLMGSGMTDDEMKAIARYYSQSRTQN